MARIKIDMPGNFNFSTVIPIRITDINYGGHVGNDTILSILHEARVRYLQSYGYGELDMGGVGLIMSDVVIEFKNEAFYGEEIIASVTCGEFSKVAFDIYLKLEKKSKDGSLATVAIAKTGMVCYDYGKKKIAAMPEEVKGRLTGQ